MDDIKEINTQNNAKEFSKRWSNFDYTERGNKDLFWIDLLENVFNVKNVTKNKYIQFEKNVPNMDEHANFIDAYIPSTRVLIEQKGPNVDLDKVEFKQGRENTTPFEQAKKYSDNLPLSEKPKWIIVCNFREFRIYNMQTSGTRPVPAIVRLDYLYIDYYQLDFLVDSTKDDIEKEEAISIKACEIINKIYHKLLEQYGEDSENPDVLKSVNKLCVRLVFCLYADDSKTFGERNMFESYMEKVPSDLWNIVLKQLFVILNTPETDRNHARINDYLSKFPYVNGGMFNDNEDDENDIPVFNDEIKDLIIKEAGKNFDWSVISPTIFGSLFESTLNPEVRKENGMHYTSVQNIHKVIDPLFIDELRQELNEIKTKYKRQSTISKEAKLFQKKLASLTFLDPACGSGNFLTETFLSLRRLENEAIKLRYGDKGYVQTRFGLGEDDIICVSINQFYGIEVNDFAVSVAKTAMWIADSQMFQQTQEFINNKDFFFLPLTSNPNIIEGNALKIDWNSVIPSYHLDYIISNPPFIGSSKMTTDQKHDVKNVLKGFKKNGYLDYVAGWYKKSADMMNDSTNIKTALVSTNSITLGQQAPILWKPLLEKEKFYINFAYQSFKWNNNAKHEAAVSCVIIAFSHINNKNKILFKNLNGNIENCVCKNINPYLRDLPNVFIESRSKPLCNVPIAVKGNQPTDNGFLSKCSNDKKNAICEKYPAANKYFKRLVGANEFLYNKVRWCLWLKDVSPSGWHNIPPIINAVKDVKEYRINSTKPQTRKDADTPYLFQEIRQPSSDYLLVPQITTLSRKYIPMGFMKKDTIINNKVFAIPNATNYEFGMLNSIVHIIWARLVSGRMGDVSYHYSDVITYNNFPFPNVSNSDRNKVTESAIGILNARMKYKDSKLADLYDVNSMPIELLKAHKKNDNIVLNIYGLKSNSSEQEIISRLLYMYNELTKLN